MSAAVSPSSPNVSIENALLAVEAAVKADRNSLDAVYLAEHRERYRRTLTRIRELCPVGGRILNIGSHYLHLSIALHQLGYEVIGIDVGVFANQPLLQQRAVRSGIVNYAVDRIDRGEFLKGHDNSFDLILFTEILEHITFNPALFWRRIYDLMKVGGLIYITTPNSLTPWKILHTLKKLVTFSGIGLSASEIFSNVTYGHHWKEYSAKELHEYFALLSPDFKVQTLAFNLSPAYDVRPSISLKAIAREMVHRAGHFIPPFRDQLEAVVRLGSKDSWRIDPPRFI